MNNEDEGFCCHCGLLLVVPDECVGDPNEGRETFLWCGGCGYVAQIEYGQIVEYIPPRAATRWTGGGPALEPCP